MADFDIKPYEGNGKYIFISYCHKDWKLVLPTIEYLANKGFNLWYDEGINPGTEWPEVIASHLNSCFACISFISENSLESHNCRKEINFALLKKKKLVSIILEPVSMSPGMELQLSNTQMIFRYKYDSDVSFFEKLMESDFLSEKKDEQKNETRYAIKRLSNNEVFDLIKGEQYIGRSSEIAFYRVKGNSTIGRFHASIEFDGTSCFIMDNSSKNFSYLNGQCLKPMKKYKINVSNIFTLADEDFILIEY